MWCSFAKACHVEMRGGNVVNSGIPLCLCPCWDLKKVCVTEWFDRTDNWTYPASFSRKCFVLRLVLLGCWLRGNNIRALLSTPNHIWLLLACRIYQVRGRGDTTKTPTYYRTVFPNNKSNQVIYSNCCNYPLLILSWFLTCHLFVCPLQSFLFRLFSSYDTSVTHTVTHMGS